MQSEVSGVRGTFIVKFHFVFCFLHFSLYASPSEIHSRKKDISGVSECNRKKERKREKDKDYLDSQYLISKGE